MRIAKLLLLLIIIMGMPLFITAPAFAQEPAGTLQIITRAEQSGNPVYGVNYGVYRAVDGVRMTELSTNADGAASLALPSGEYYLRNYSVPFGFLPERARIFFTITDSGAVIVEITAQRDMSIRYVGYAPISLPQTGEMIPVMNYVMGLAFIGAALLLGAVLLRLSKRKNISTRKGDFLA